MPKSLNYKIKIHLSSTILKLVYGLNRKSVRGRENYLYSIKKGIPVIIAVWHGHLLSIAILMETYKTYGIGDTFNIASFAQKLATLHEKASLLAQF